MLRSASSWRIRSLTSVWYTQQRSRLRLMKCEGMLMQMRLCLPVIPAIG